MDFELEEIPLDAAVAELGEHTLVEFEEGRAILSVDGWGRHVAESRTPQNLRLQATGLDNRLKGVDVERSVGDVAAFARVSEPLRAFRLPTGTVTYEHSLSEGGREGLVPFLLIGSLIAGVGIASVLNGMWQGLGFAIGLVVLVALLGGAILVSMKLAVSGEVSYQVGETRRRLTELTLPLDVEAAGRQVEEVKEEYGRLLTDLAYRIENPALFDAASPATERLTLALFEWDTTVTGLDDAARVALASTIVSSFREARDHAERIGMDHLPAETRDTAAKALKAAQLAQDPNAAPPEREAARRAAIDLLAGLALYYLPTPDEAREALGGRRLKQLPGRSAS